MDRASLNEAQKLLYRDPEVALRELREIELVAAGLDISPSVKHLRGNELKGPREYRQAALFTLGMASNLGRAVRFCPVEAADYDFIATWHFENTQHFVPVQLKELPPEELNPTANVQAIVDSLAKYSSQSLAVGVFLNRQGTFRPQQIKIPPLRIGALWFLFAAAEDQSEWVLYGNVLGRPQATRFAYPA